MAWLGPLFVAVASCVLAAACHLLIEHRDAMAITNNEVTDVPVVVQLLSLVGCVSGFAGASLLCGKLRPIRTAISSSYDQITFDKCFAMFDTRARYVQPQVTSLS
eukprot:TRINITY_DN4118_c0_g1_i1.p2 TRINITY_DN4118_c0_g1~~TRINITY_DN4118_c0_g1_i1.p2  ORF type:complete len:105 (-),score=0.06 TRINITY_DN4118_c0_g1_i1:228-542(-)